LIQHVLHVDKEWEFHTWQGGHYHQVFGRGDSAKIKGSQHNQRKF